MVPATLLERKGKEKSGPASILGSRIPNQHLWQCMDEARPDTENSKRKTQISGTDKYQ